MKFLTTISIFIAALLAILGASYLSSYFYISFIGLNMLQGFCSGEGCLGFLLFVELPIVFISAVVFTVFIKFFGKRGLMCSLLILIGLIITPMIISGRAEYSRASKMLNVAISAMSELDKQITDVSRREGSKICFTQLPGEYSMQIGSLPYPNGPIVNGIRDYEKFYFVEGNGITATTRYNRFNLFKLSDEKTTGNVHIAVQPIKYTEDFYQSNKREGNKYSDYREKYMPYVYLNYENSLELKSEYNMIPIGSVPFCQGLEIQNAGKENGKPIITLLIFDAGRIKKGK